MGGLEDPVIRNRSVGKVLEVFMEANKHHSAPLSCLSSKPIEK